MQGKIKVGEKEIEFLANGATPFWFNQIFHEDFFTQTQDIASAGITVGVFSKVAFVMAKQAEGADMKKATEGQYMKWLEGFEALDLPNAIPEIVDLYTAQTTTTATPKK